MRRGSLLLLLSAGVFAARLAWSLRTPEPPGTDGYYYVVQIADWSSGLGLHVPDASWVLRFLGILGLVFEPILAMKVGAALLAALVVPAAWLLGRELGRPWTLALLAAASPTLTHLGGDFPKNLGMAAPWLLFAAGLIGRRWWLAVLGGVLCASAHRIGAAFVVLGLLGLLAERVERRVLLGGVSLIAVFCLLSWVLPGLLHPSDLERVHLEPSLPLSWLSLRPTHPLQVLELLGGWTALIYGLLRERRWIFLLPLAVCLLVPWKQDELDLGYRLALMTPLLALGLIPRIPAPFCLPLLLVIPVGFDPRQHPPYERYRGLIEGLPERPELLIAHVGINFLYDHETGGEAMAWAPEPELDRQRIGRIVWGVRPHEWTGEFTVLDGDYSYVSEATWEALSEGPISEDLAGRIEDGRNPRRVRPAGLTRRR